MLFGDVMSSHAICLRVTFLLQMSVPVLKDDQSSSYRFWSQSKPFYFFIEKKKRFCFQGKY